MNKRLNMGKQYQICTRCIMDSSDPDIIFDKHEVCNHCRRYDELVKEKNPSNEERNRRLQAIIKDIKKSAKGKEYDCLIGLSGGVDSSYAAYLAKKLGLNPLAIHLDNGWDSESAVKNIENIIKKLDIDFHSYVIDWEEFKDLQRSFFKASVVDIEMLTDHAIAAVLYQIAKKKKYKYIISGENIVTEAILPRAWVHRKSDLKNIKAIQKNFGSKSIKSFPTASTFELAVYNYINRIKVVSLLDYFPYDKEQAQVELEKELGWKRYKGKHGESIFTKFYQGYILPKKFKIDKRRAHYSNLICSGQMAREEALEMMGKEFYNAEELKEDKEYVIKKLGFSEDELEATMRSSVKSHYDYPTDQIIYRALVRIRKMLGL